MKYAFYLDYMSDKHPVGNPGWEYRKSEANTLAEAITEAEKIWRENADALYLLRIMEKDGRAKKDPYTYIVSTPYRALLCKRSEKGGWHLNTPEYYEDNDHVVFWNHYKNAEWFACA